MTRIYIKKNRKQGIAANVQVKKQTQTQKEANSYYERFFHLDKTQNTVGKLSATVAQSTLAPMPDKPRAPTVAEVVWSTWDLQREKGHV